MLKKGNGITLIALIITIVLILLLAGVVLNLSIGDNRPIQKNTRSSTEYIKTQPTMKQKD